MQPQYSHRPTGDIFAPGGECVGCIHSTYQEQLRMIAASWSLSNVRSSHRVHNLCQALQMCTFCAIHTSFRSTSIYYVSARRRTGSQRGERFRMLLVLRSPLLCRRSENGGPIQQTTSFRCARRNALPVYAEGRYLSAGVQSGAMEVDEGCDDALSCAR